MRASGCAGQPCRNGYFVNHWNAAITGTRLKAMTKAAPSVKAIIVQTMRASGPLAGAYPIRRCAVARCTTKAPDMRACLELYTQGKVCHVGRFPQLEEQMLNMSSAGYVGAKSPDRLRAPLWGPPPVVGA